MPYCHRCRAEYIDSVSTCPECGEPLFPEPPPPAGNPDIKLVVVYLAQGEIDAQVVRSLLEANGIDCSLSGESVRLTHGLTVDGLAQVKILVREDDEARARETISSSDYLRDCPACGEANPAEVSTCRYCGKPIGTPTP
jgi:rRNA maturation endonuclease Nob1